MSVDQPETAPPPAVAPTPQDIAKTDDPGALPDQALDKVSGGGEYDVDSATSDSPA